MANILLHNMCAHNGKFPQRRSFILHSQYPLLLMTYQAKEPGYQQPVCCMMTSWPGTFFPRSCRFVKGNHQRESPRKVPAKQVLMFSFMLSWTKTVEQATDLPEIRGAHVTSL